MFAKFTLDGRTVFVAPAAGFYMGYGRGANKVRIAFVLNEDDLDQAMTVLAAGLAAYRERQRRVPA